MMSFTYSEWVQWPDTTLVMTAGDSLRAGVDAPDPADVFVRDGTGVDSPRGSYTWKGALGGPWPQTDADAYRLGWHGTKNFGTGKYYFNNINQAQYVGRPLEHWPQPDNPDGGGDSEGAFVYGYSWSKLLANTELSCFWEGSLLSFYTLEVVDAAGQLGTGEPAPTDPDDPLYEGLFEPGADLVEFESDTCELLDLEFAPDESQNKPTAGPGYGEDNQGAWWGLVTQRDNGGAGWGYWVDANDRQKLFTDEGGPRGYLYGAVVTYLGLHIPRASEPLTFTHLDLGAVALNGGLMQFIVVPIYATDPDGIWPEVIGDISGDPINHGSWQRFRASPRFVLRPLVRPTRFRARYPAAVTGTGLQVWDDGQWLSQSAGSGRFKVWDGEEWRLAEPVPGEVPVGRLKVWDGSQWRVTGATYYRGGSPI